jgi:hypothetical protein
VARRLVVLLYLPDRLVIVSSESPNCIKGVYYDIVRWIYCVDARRQHACHGSSAFERLRVFIKQIPSTFVVPVFNEHDPCTCRSQNRRSSLGGKLM